MFRYFLLWFPMPFIAVINGSIRQFLYTDSLGETTAHQISTFSLIILLGAYLWFVLKKWPVSSKSKAVLVGVLWLVLTLAFETTMSVVLLQKSFSETLAAYNIVNGELWPLVLIFVLIMPMIMYKIKSFKEA